MKPSTPHQALALRSLVLLPGALVEGALAVVLPWFLARASLGTVWFGLLPALLVGAALVGTLAAPLATKHWGSRSVVLICALVSATGLGVATALWFLGFAVAAFGVVLITIAADNMSDVTFSARTPVMARMAKVQLMQFTSANWLWTVCGLAVGSALAGAAMGEGALDRPSIGWLAAGAVALSLLVAMALAVLMPRDSRVSHGIRGVPFDTSKRVLWNQRTVMLIALIAAISFLYGPMDNLLAPAHLASHGRKASAFGAIMAASAVGMAVGLLLTQTVRADRHSLALLSVGLAGMVAQFAFLWWLPADLALVVVSFVTSAAVAPLLPLLESAALKAVASTHRTVLLAAAATAASLADLTGTAVFGALAGAAGTGSALALATALAGLGLAVAMPVARKAIWPRS